MHSCSSQIKDFRTTGWLISKYFGTSYSIFNEIYSSNDNFLACFRRRRNCTSKQSLRRRLAQRYRILLKDCTEKIVVVSISLLNALNLKTFKESHLKPNEVVVETPHPAKCTEPSNANRKRTLRSRCKLNPTSMIIVINHRSICRALCLQVSRYFLTALGPTTVTLQATAKEKDEGRRYCMLYISSVFFLLPFILILNI